MRLLKIIPYYGAWPVYMHLYLESCRRNPMLDVVFVTDLEPFPDSPPNVKYLALSFRELMARIEGLFGMNATGMVAYKLCDFRPAFGIIFADLVRNFDFWGYGDNDLVFGDVAAFLTPELLASHDVLSFKKQHLQGPLTFFRNVDAVNNLFRDGGEYEAVFATPEYRSFDEFGLTGFHTKVSGREEVGGLPSDNISVIAFKRALEGRLRVHAEQHGRECLLGDDLLCWREGRLWNVRTGEAHLFYHWVLEKRAVWFKYPAWLAERPAHFYISRTGFYRPAEVRVYALLHRWRLLSGTARWAALKGANYSRRRTGRIVEVDTYPSVGWVKDLRRPW